MTHLRLVKNENTVIPVTEVPALTRLVSVTQEELMYRDLAEKAMGDLFSIVNAINMMNMTGSPEYLRKHMREELPDRINKALKTIEEFQTQEFY